MKKGRTRFLVVTSTVVLITGLLVPRAAFAWNPFGSLVKAFLEAIRTSGGLPVTDPLSLEQLQSAVKTAGDQYAYLQQQYAALKNLPQRYRGQFTTWLHSWAPSHYGNTGGMVNVLNTGGDPTGAYGNLTSQLQVYPSASSISGDELANIKRVAARVDLRDGSVMSLMQTVGQLRANNQQVAQQIANLNSDTLSDGQTAMQVAERQATAQVLMLQSQRDAANLQVQAAQLEALRAMEEREHEVENSNDVLWLHQTVGATTRASVANQGAELNAWRLNP
jgi:hypothetical protein